MNFHSETDLGESTPRALDFNARDCVAVDGDLLDLAGIHAPEYVEIYNIRSGESFIARVIRARASSGIVAIRCVDADKVEPGDLVIISARLDRTSSRGNGPRMLTTAVTDSRGGTASRPH